jgi:hypothetical protein
MSIDFLRLKIIRIFFKPSNKTKLYNSLKFYNFTYVILDSTILLDQT